MIEKAKFEVTVGHDGRFLLRVSGEAGVEEMRLACAVLLRGCSDRLKPLHADFIDRVAQAARTGTMKELDRRSVAFSGWWQGALHRFEGHEKGSTTDGTTYAEPVTLRGLYGTVSPVPAVRLGEEFTLCGEGVHVRLILEGMDGSCHSNGPYILPAQESSIRVSE